MPHGVVTSFTRCLIIISHSRAGWDYDLTPAQKAKEDQELKDALAEARGIWAHNTDMHDALRAAFKDASPLATMTEIENTP